MRNAIVSAVAAMLVLVPAILTGSQHALAKPKKSSFGCSMSDLQSSQAAACIAKAEQDIMSGSSRIHVVYCSSTGKKLCCLSDGNNIVDQSCSILSIRGQRANIPQGNILDASTVPGATGPAPRGTPSTGVAAPSLGLR